MKLLRQWGIILTIYLICEVIANMYSLPLPGSIVGLLLLFILLCCKIIKPEQIKEPTDFLLQHLAFFFIPATTKIILYYNDIVNTWWIIAIVCIVSTITTFGSTGVVTQLINSKKKGNENE